MPLKHSLGVVTIGCAIGAGPIAHGSFDLLPLPPFLLPNNHFPTMTAGADLDGDGLTDLVVPGRGGEGRVQVLRNLGGGVLAIHQTLDIGGQTDWAALGDLDGSGNLDLVLALRNGPRGLMVRQGLGDGTFTTAGQHLPDARALAGITLADLDNNGSLDAVAVDYSAGVARIYRNDGTGVLAQDQPIRLIAHTGGVVSAGHVVATDLDGDGHPDLVVTATGGGRVVTMSNRGDGTFEPAINRRYQPVENYQPGLINTVAADINGDGSIDLLSPWLMGFIGQLIAVLPNDGAGEFGPPIVSQSVYGSASYFGAVADLDGDGLPEVMVGHALSGVLSIGRNIGNYAFASPQVIPIGTFVRHILPMDMDGDGVIDLVAADAPSHLLHVLINGTEQIQGGLAAGVPGNSGAINSAPVRVAPSRDPWRRELEAAIPFTSIDGADIGLWLLERQR